MNLDRKCIPACNGCDYNKEDFCAKFLSPESKFRMGRGVSCGMATHIVVETAQEGRIRIGQQKQKSRG